MEKIEWRGLEEACAAIQPGVGRLTYRAYADPSTGEVWAESYTSCTERTGREGAAEIWSCGELWGWRPTPAELADAADKAAMKGEK